MHFQSALPTVVLSHYLSPVMATAGVAVDRESSQGQQHLQWSEVGSTADDLRILMRELYWRGAKRDVLDIIHTLRTWRGEDYRDVCLKEDQLHAGVQPFETLGIDTFLSRAASTTTSDNLSVLQILYKFPRVLLTFRTESLLQDPHCGRSQVSLKFWKNPIPHLAQRSNTE